MGKYNMMNKQGTQPSYINRMRFAGAYFIAAEAYARNNNEPKALYGKLPRSSRTCR
jgi:starch-binding outer membrane protein, SusD/RagB family